MAATGTAVLAPDSAGGRCSVARQKCDSEWCKVPIVALHQRKACRWQVARFSTKYLLQNIIPLCAEPWHGACEGQQARFEGRRLLSTDIIEGLTRVGGAIALLAAYKIGSGGSAPRARQRLARAGVAGWRYARTASGRGSACIEGPPKKAKRLGDRLRFGAAVLWMALLLSILAYAQISGEAGLASLEAIGVGAVTE
jgi:hypothetical protein